MTDTLPAERLPTDTVLIVGAGLAGLYCGLRLERPSVIIAADTPGRGGSSVWAQGGMAAALGPGDTPAAHAADTLAAGAGLCDPAAVAVVTEEGPRHVAALADLGVPFDRDAAGHFLLSLEAAHSQARVARVRGDLAGREIMKAVGRAAVARASVELRPRTMARRLLRSEDGRVAGVETEDDRGRVGALVAGDTILATGGVGGLYAVTTNPPSARGDAMALAVMAGATVVDPEFVQFHPTAIDVGRDPAPLATEALRGEGARLVDRDGRAIVSGPAGNLAPRDVVARAVHRARQEGRGAYLDATDAVGAALPERFPTVYEACREAGLDPRTAPIPVAPAAHYHMGGVASDLDGATDVAGLWVLGEAASTGVHGGNRLASNSLLEAVVFADRAARALDARRPVAASGLVPGRSARLLPAGPRLELRRAMARHAGVERDRAGLETLLDRLAALDAAHGPALEVVSARLIAIGALRRVESRGAHARRDAPDPAPETVHTRLSRTDLSVDPASGSR